MDIFFDNLPSTSQSMPKSGHEDPQMTEDAGHNSSRVKMTEIQERHASANVDDIRRRVQDLVERINDRRTSDQEVMDSFQDQLMKKMTEMCQQMKEHMYTVYEENSNEMQVKLHQLSEVLENCIKLNKELMEANQALAGLREGLALSPEP